MQDRYDNHAPSIAYSSADSNLPSSHKYSSVSTSTGGDTVELFRQTASYVDRILRGAKPSDLPVQAPTKFELMINRKTAKRLGLSLPPSLLVRADEVIE